MGRLRDGITIAGEGIREIVNRDKEDVGFFQRLRRERRDERDGEDSGDEFHGNHFYRRATPARSKAATMLSKQILAALTGSYPGAFRQIWLLTSQQKSPR